MIETLQKGKIVRDVTEKGIIKTFFQRKQKIESVT